MVFFRNASTLYCIYTGIFWALSFSVYALQSYIYQNVLRIVFLAQFCRSLKSLEEMLLGQLLGPQMWAMSLVRYFHLSSYLYVSTICMCV